MLQLEASVARHERLIQELSSDIRLLRKSAADMRVAGLLLWANKLDGEADAYQDVLDRLTKE
jgi:hypothetical protein